ncbi:M1 family metallopeptidase [Chondromyces apiculatus]|uniref:Aminopeptidase n=1 Tax=Chondromyces apiculatus DSM 436 TaxID=1192034 RepID=A0A017SYY6_9BACT|nr:M1 family metallopeptidase [Chondromyces apiculatus]EYF02163.1 peptidase, M1 (aminopeptidase N) family [Chondromyces apiculatus DSM 436]
MRRPNPRITTLTAVLAALATASCASSPPAPPPPSGAPPALASSDAESGQVDGKGGFTPPGIRLPRTVSPSRYSATLTVLPGEAALEGEIVIDLDLTEPTSVLWLNAKAISVERVEVEASGKRVGARVVPGGEEHLGVALEGVVPPGKAKLTLRYRGAVSSKDDRGVFVEEEGGAKFVFSQFESVEARRAFPCFDEPSFKVPWQLSLRVRAGEMALSNTPVVSEEPAGEGMKLVRFAETKPLPSYLVAFAVGPFELVDAGKAGAGQTPVRIAVPRGRAAEARWAKEATPALLGVLEKQLGIPYPYEKLDVVPVPKLVSFGAMENPGLITFSMPLTLAKPDEETPSFKRGFGRIMAHELGHQWFGNLVTTAFWDDIWLNEAFADWVMSRAVKQWQPSWDEEIAQAQAAAWAMSQDALVSARKIRQEIVSKDDIQNAFDPITYQKGATVLSMVEGWLGPERFMQGVRRYLERHAHKTATSADFLASMQEVGGKEVSAVLSSFLDQPGVPLLRSEITCEAGAAPALRLTQERLLPMGSAGAGGASAPWSIPVCYRLDGGGRKGAETRACTVVSQPSVVVPLGAGARCPAWAMLQAGGAGYYHVAYDEEALRALIGRGGRGGAPLSLVERVTVLRDLEALTSAGKVPIADALGVVVEAAKDPDPRVLEAALGIAAGVPRSHVPEALAPAYARFVREVFGARARALGFKPRAGESEALRLLRPRLLRLTANRGEEPSLVAEARRLADGYLADPASLEPEVVDTVLAIAARHGDRKLFDRMRAEALKEKEMKRRTILLRALRDFADPAIAREVMGLVLADTLDVRETVWLLFPGDARMAGTALGFVKEHFDALVKRMPGELLGDLPFVGSGLCDAAAAADLDAFFRERIGRLTGGPRRLAQAVEEISLCSALREAQGASLSTFLARYEKKGRGEKG